MKELAFTSYQGGTSVSERRLSALDLVVAAVDSPRQPMDFGIVFHLRNAPSIDALRAGAQSARNLFPSTGSIIEGRHWKPTDVANHGVTSSSGPASVVEEFFNRRLDLHEQAPVQQLLLTVQPKGRTILVTRAHHAAADGSSLALWLHHQFRVAYGLANSVTQPVPFESIPLRQHRLPVRKSPASFRGRTEELWPANGTTTGDRSWITIELRAPLDADILATAALETLVAWNRIHGMTSRRIGLWFPVSIRRRGSTRVGNATSRVRIYPRYSDGASFDEKCGEVRRQIRWSLKHGEWALPSNSFLLRLPCWLSLPLLKLHLNRPWADMGTSAFTCAQEWSGHDDPVYHDVEKIECVGLLHRRHALVMNSVKHGEVIWLTFTYDRGRISHSEVEEFASLYRQQLTNAGCVVS